MKFESGVKQYGLKAQKENKNKYKKFESGVKQYGLKAERNELMKRNRLFEFVEGKNNAYNCKNCPANENNKKIITIWGKGYILPCREGKCLCVK